MVSKLFCELCGEILGEEGLCDSCDKNLCTELTDLDLEELEHEWIETKKE